LRSISLIVAILLNVPLANAALAQSADSGRALPEHGVACPPDVKGEAPTVGGGSSEPLSDKLARSKG
jgi:hypothetical protein